MSRRQYWLGFGVIFLIAIFFRFYQLGKIPGSLYWDEVAILLDAKVIAQTGADMHGNSWLQVLFPSYGDYKLPVYIWLATLSVKILGVTELAVRLPSALAGLGTIFLSALIARELFFKLTKQQKDLLQLWIMLVIAISPWAIMFSRTAFEGHLGQLILTFSIWIALKARHKQFLVLLSPIFGALATYTYFSVRFVWPVIFVLAIFLVLKKQAWKWLVPGLTIFFVLLLPMFKSPLYGASNQFRLSTTSVLNVMDYPMKANQYRQLAGNTLVDKFLFHPDVFIGRELLKNYADNLSFDFLFLKGDPNLRHGTGEHGLFLLIFLPIFVIGLFALFQKYRPQFLFLGSWWLIALLPASVPETTPHALRSLNALVPLGLILGMGLWELNNQLKLQHKSKILQLSLFGLILLNVAQFGYHYFTQYQADSAYEWQVGYKEMAAEINQTLPHVADVYIDTFDERFYLWLLAYGDWTGEQIQALPKDNYQPKSLDKITFHEFHWHKISSLDRKIIVAGLKSKLDQGLKEYQIQPVWEKEIAQTKGAATLKLLMLER